MKWLQPPCCPRLGSPVSLEQCEARAKPCMHGNTFDHGAPAPFSEISAPRQSSEHRLLALRRDPARLPVRRAPRPRASPSSDDLNLSVIGRHRLSALVIAPEPRLSLQRGAVEPDAQPAMGQQSTGSREGLQPAQRLRAGKGRKATSPVVASSATGMGR